MTSSTPVQGVATTVYRTRPILGPLTTVFTQPPECTFAAVRGTLPNIGFRAQTCRGEALADESTCWPEATAAAPSPVLPLHGWGFYSPGILCPAGYITACYATQGYSSGWDMQYPLEDGETAVGCCPTGFSCAGFGNFQTCVSTASQSILTARCSGNSFVSSDYGTFPIVYTSTNAENSTTATRTNLTVAAPMIQINWRSEDLVTATQTVPTHTASGGDSASASSNSISAGGLAGAVIAGVVVLFAIAAAILTLMRRRKARKAQPTKDDLASFPQDRNQNLEGIIPSASELSPSHARPELSEYRNPNELSAYQAPVELPGSLRGPHAVQGQS